MFHQSSGLQHCIDPWGQPGSCDSSQAVLRVVGRAMHLEAKGTPTPSSPPCCSPSSLESSPTKASVHGAARVQVSFWELSWPKQPFREPLSCEFCSFEVSARSQCGWIGVWERQSCMSPMYWEHFRGSPLGNESKFVLKNLRCFSSGWLERAPHPHPALLHHSTAFLSLCLSVSAYVL